MFADEIGRDLPSCQRVLRKIPEGLLAAQRLVHGGIFLALMLDSHEESIVRAKGELALDLILATFDGCS
jgi:hypothetical protein